MKTQSLLLTTLSAASFLILAACGKPEPQAGGPHHGPGAPGGPNGPLAREDGPRGERLKEALGLSDEQAEKLKAIHQVEREKIEALRAETRKQLETVLTPEQIAKMEEFRDRRHERMQAGPGGPGGPEGKFGKHRMNPEHRLERMKQELALTDDQTKKIEVVLKKQHEAAMAVKKDASGKPADREEMKALREATKTQIDAILTAEQKTKLAELREKGPGGPGPAHKDGFKPGKPGPKPIE